MFALLTDYFLAWNQNINISLCGLPEKYDGLYCGDLLEMEIQKMARWKHCVDPPHPDWVSTRTVKCTVETFGFIINKALSSATVNDDSLNSDDENSSHASISSLADAAADELLDLDTGDYENEHRNGWQCFMVNSELTGEFLGMLNGNTFKPILQTFKVEAQMKQTTTHQFDSQIWLTVTAGTSGLTLSVLRIQV
jgi:hypothetical protein